MSSKRVLLVCLDGATFDLIEPWAEAGLLPTFARLLHTGAHGWLRSAPNYTSPAWSTLATGLNPARHGLFNASVWSDDRRTLRPASAADQHGKTFWQIASDAGRRVVVVNYPFTHPVEPVSGYVIAGAGAPDKATPGFCYPAGLLEEVEQTVGNYSINSPIQIAMKEGRPQDAIAGACAVAERQTDALLYLLSRQPWDLAVIVYSLSDELQHFFWRQMAAGGVPQREAILDGYRWLERQIERLLAHVGEDTTLLIVSDHGFGPICGTPEMLSERLSQMGCLRYLEAARQPMGKRLTLRAYGWLRRSLSERQKTALRRWLPGLRQRVETDARFAGIDWAASSAYVGLCAWEIWINTKGREPQGCVTPGAEYDQICRDLVAALLDWRTPEGQKRVRSVHRREKVYRGPFLDQAPDLTIVWNTDAAPPPEILPGNLSGFDGDHQPEGILLAWGPGIRGGQTIRNAGLEDIAPTILRMLDAPQPEMDGNALAALMAKGIP